jgi:membrane protein implicated in regulation of membrane protease activity
MLLVTIALIIPAHALVAGIETVLFLVLAIILALVGKTMLKIGAPPKTMTTLKEDAEWARQVLKRNGK